MGKRTGVGRVVGDEETKGWSLDEVKGLGGGEVGLYENLGGRILRRLAFVHMRGGHLRDSPEGKGGHWRVGMVSINACGRGRALS